MNKSLIFAGMLALAGQAHAEDIPACIDQINLTVEVKPSVKTNGIEAVIDSILKEVEQFYQSEMQLPVTWKYQTQREPNDIHITYGEIDDIMQEWFPNAKAIIQYTINYFPAKELKQLEAKRGTTPTPSNEQLWVQGERDDLKNTSGIVDPAKRKIYILTQVIRSRMEYLWEQGDHNLISAKMAYETVTAHELGHILGLKHTGMGYTGRAGKHNLMYYGGMPFALDTYSFSLEDKAKIKAQLCEKQQ